MPRKRISAGGRVDENEKKKKKKSNRQKRKKSKVVVNLKIYFTQM